MTCGNGIIKTSQIHIKYVILFSDAVADTIANAIANANVGFDASTIISVRLLLKSMPDAVVVSFEKISNSGFGGCVCMRYAHSCMLYC